MCHYLPFLEIGRLAGWLRRKSGIGNRSHDDQAGRLQPLRLLPSGGNGSGAGGITGETIGGRRNGSNSGAGNGGSSARRGRRNAGASALSSPSIDRAQDGSEGHGGEFEHNNTNHDAVASGMKEEEPHGRAGSESGGRAWARGDTRADGLEGLTRQVFPSCQHVLNFVVECLPCFLEHERRR